MRALLLGAALLVAGCQTTSSLPPPPSRGVDLTPPPEIAELMRQHPINVKQETFKLRLPSGEVIDMQTGRIDLGDYARHLKAWPAQGLDEQLEPVHIVSPIYPLKFRATNVQGEATIAFVLGTDGRPHSLAVVSATHPEFAEAAAAAVAQWRFKPGRVKGKAVNVMVVQQFPFMLEN